MNEPHYPLLFSPVEIGGFTLRNRLAHASIVTKLVQQGRATEAFINYYRSRARGGTGLIVTEPLAMTTVNRVPHRLRAWDDQGMDDLKRLAEAVEGEDTRLLGQVQDTGRGRHAVGRNEGAVGASALPDDLSWTVPRVLSAGEIRQMIDEWASGCQRLQQAGWSGVEISAGHGHIFHQFLSPWSNLRKDEYGGDLPNRARFLTDLIAAIRSSCGRPFIIGLKLPGDDGVPNSIDFQRAQELAAYLAGHPVIGGEMDYWTWCWGSHSRSLWQHLPDAHGPRHPYLDKIRLLRSLAPGIPSGALGYITDPNECERALQDGTADLCFLGRPLITDPAFGKKASAGREAAIRYCVSGNTCWRSIIEGGRLECDNNPRVGAADEDDWKPEQVFLPANSSTLPGHQHAQKLVVVGGGIAGLEAAYTAARRGFDVTLFSASKELGGKTRLHAELPGGENLSSIYDYTYLAGKAAGVKFLLGRRAALQDILDCSPDRVLLATGARLSVPACIPEEFVEDGLIPDLRSMVADMLRRGDAPREAGRLVVLDRDHTEMTYAATELLARHFETVTLVTPRERIASDVSLINRQGIYQRLFDLGVELLTNVDVHDLDLLEEAAIEVVNVYNGKRTRLNDIAGFTYATARLPNNELLTQLHAAGTWADVVGDCRAPRGVLAATREGYDMAMNLA